MESEKDCYEKINTELTSFIETAKETGTVDSLKLAERSALDNVTAYDLFKDENRNVCEYYVRNGALKKK